MSSNQFLTACADKPHLHLAICLSRHSPFGIPYFSHHAIGRHPVTQAMYEHTSKRYKLFDMHYTFIRFFFFMMCELANKYEHEKS